MPVLMPSGDMGAIGPELWERPVGDSAALPRVYSRLVFQSLPVPPGSSVVSGCSCPCRLRWTCSSTARSPSHLVAMGKSQYWLDERRDRSVESRLFTRPRRAQCR